MKFPGLQQIVLFATLASAFTLAGCQKTELAEVPVQEQVNGSPIEGQFIVILKSASGELMPEASPDTQAGFVARQKSAQRLLISEMGIGAIAIKETFEGTVNGFTAKLTTEQVSKLKRRPDVAYLEQDRFITLAKPLKEVGGIKPGPVEVKPTENNLPYTTITPLAGEYIPWNIERVGYGDGTGKTVWVIDSGVDTEHPDLNVDETKSRSFIYGNTSIKDGFGHGTKVAGIIAAKNNGSGMIGVASNATVVALRVFDDAGLGTTSRVISAVNYVVTHGQPGDVVNISLGGGISSTLDKAVTTAAEKGFLFAIAAGNSGTDCSSTSPARIIAPNVYTISAVDNLNQLWERSNYGPSVNFAAPGVNITTTKMNGGLSVGSSGTSFAAPHVAGILLLRKDIVPNGTVIGDKDNYPEPIASSK